MIKPSDKVLAEELVKKGILTQEKVNQCLSEVQSSVESLKEHVTRKGYVTEKQILDVLSTILRLANFDLKNATVDKAVIERVPVRFAFYYKIMPVKIDDKSIILASAKPLDIKVQDEIRLHLGLDPKIVLVKESDILDAQNKYYGLAANTVDRLAKDAPKISEEYKDNSSNWVEDLEKQADEASIAKLVNQILFEAYKKRATDIHIEPYRNKVRVRYRIDGVLVDANIPLAVKQFLPSIISRIKIMANLSIVEKRIPQDGSAVVKTKEKNLDLRISTIPTPYGESMVIRILPTDVILLSLEKLGLERRNIHFFRELLKKPHGIILVTGPTGSGKTTTLYACLNEINNPSRKIITLEDPLEYEMEGITQIQVNPKVNLTFAAGLRSILRHDPDIVMVGEIRDLETAEIAIRTALTGHLVFSTLHTNDAASGVTRLVEMGLEPFLVASSIEAFVAQRLVRIICSKCKEEVKTPLLDIREEMAQGLDIKDINQIKIFTGRGCDECNNTGFYGRTAIYEVLVINEDIRSAILAKDRADHIKNLARKNGMLTLRQDGWRKVLAGVTTPAEVMNVTVKDEYPEFPGTKDPADFRNVKPDVEKKETPGDSSQQPMMPKQVRFIAKDVLSAKNEYESRIYSRLHEKVGIRYTLILQDKDNPSKLISEKIEHASVTKDISAGGLRFVSGYSLASGTIIELKIQLEPRERSIDCLAKVCRVEDDTLSAMFTIVVYYLDISSADRVKIDKYVHERMKNITTGQ